MSDSLAPEQRVKAAQLLAATLEVNPHSEQLLLILFSTDDANAEELAATLDGLVNPAFPTTLGVTPPHFRPDYAERLRMVDILRAQEVDANVLANLDRAREQLVLLAAQPQ
jgi:hypothetical protein